jgi:hypothetical protein
LCYSLASVTRSHDKVAKQALGGGIAKHSLWVPLNANHPIRVTRPFDAFDGAIAGMSRDAQALSRRCDGLVMRAVHLAQRPACDGR